jgi:hypothetical protein
VAGNRISFGSVALGVIETGFNMGGHYLREIAVLIVVFIPLDLWKHEEITGLRLVEVIVLSFVTLLAGMVFEWTSCGVKRGKVVWEREEGAQ